MRIPSGRPPSYIRGMADIVASEGLLLAARELVVLLVVLAFIAWAGYRLVRESQR
jgi:hypothetical protein